MLSRALKLLRTYHQLKQIELADGLSISKSHLSEIEKGSKTPSVDLLERYAEFFKMPLSSIMLFSERISDEKNTGEQLRVAAADKVLRLLEWIDERNAITSS